MAARTAVLPAEPDYVSPAGVSEIRLLLQRPQGEITHATCPAGKLAKPAIVEPPDELYFVLAGFGSLWRRSDNYEGVTRLSPGRWTTIPAGTAFQYRSAATSDLVFLLVVVPRWEPENHRLLDSGRWTDESSPDDSDSGEQAHSWQEGTLAKSADYLAPDGSEIRLLTQLTGGSVAHCTLHPGRASTAVRHRSVDEIWFVLGGHGALWRKPLDGDGWLTSLRYGVCVDIEAGEAFQFRSTGLDPLTVLILTMPSWPGPDEAERVTGNALWT